MWEFENKSIDAKNNVRKLKTLYVGDEAEKLAKYLKKNKILKPIVLDFHRTVRKAYIQAGNYLQQKYPVENPLLEFMTGLDPNSRQMSQTHEKLISLKSFFEPFISIDNSFDFTAELRNYVINFDLPQTQETGRLDVWWNKIFETKRYPILRSVVKASLSIFTGPMAESSFSMMNDIIDSQSGRTEIDTYSAIMSVKYQLKLAGVTVLSKFYRKDILRDPVDGNMCYYIRTASSRYKKKASYQTRGDVTMSKEINHEEKSKNQGN